MLDPELKACATSFWNRTICGVYQNRARCMILIRKLPSCARRVLGLAGIRPTESIILLRREQELRRTSNSSRDCSALTARQAGSWEASRSTRLRISRTFCWTFMMVADYLKVQIFYQTT